MTAREAIEKLTELSRYDPDTPLIALSNDGGEDRSPLFERVTLGQQGVAIAFRYDQGDWTCDDCDDKETEAQDARDEADEVRSERDDALRELREAREEIEALKAQK